MTKLGELANTVGGQLLPAVILGGRAPVVVLSDLGAPPLGRCSRADWIFSATGRGGS
jgi:hypothetical protein